MPESGLIATPEGGVALRFSDTGSQRVWRPPTIGSGPLDASQGTGNQGPTLVGLLPLLLLGEEKGALDWESEAWVRSSSWWLGDCGVVLPAWVSSPPP